MAKNDYSPINLGDTKNLSNDEWLKWREHGPNYKDPFAPDYIPVTVGGSAVSVIFGDNPWQSKLELYHKKSETEKPKYERPMNQEILDAGHQLEEFCSLQFMNKMKAEGVKDKIEIYNDTNFYQHPLYKFAVVNLDRRLRINGAEGILECKTTSSISDIKNWKDGVVPKKYEWQCRYYMATMNVNFCYICCVWGFTINDCAVILVNRDKQIEDEMMQEVAEFVECCELGIEPEMQPSGHLKALNNYYLRLYGEVKEDNLTALELPDTSEINFLIDGLMDIKEKKDAAEKALAKVEEEEYKLTSQLAKYLKGNTYCSFRLDSESVVGIKVKYPKKRDSFDEDKFIVEHPDLYDKYKKESLDVTTLKKKEKLIAPKYVIPGEINIEGNISLVDVTKRNIPVA